MINPPSCLIGNLPNNLDIDLKDVMQPDMMNGYAQPGNMNQPRGGASGQVDMAQL